jgi:hypothetical protein
MIPGDAENGALATIPMNLTFEQAAGSTEGDHGEGCAFGPEGSSADLWPDRSRAKALLARRIRRLRSGRDLVERRWGVGRAPDYVDSETTLPTRSPTPTTMTTMPTTTINRFAV